MCVSICVYKYLFFIHLFLLFSVNNTTTIHRLPLPYAPYFIRRHAQIEETWIVDTRLLYLEVMKHYFMFVYMVYSLKMVSTKDHRGL